MLTVYGIETYKIGVGFLFGGLVATVLTVYGIETQNHDNYHENDFQLQQCLPFTVLKRFHATQMGSFLYMVATVLTVYGIETFRTLY